MAELTYITTCKGRLAHLKQTLPRAVAQGWPCVVVDYSCPEGTGDWVAANYPNVTVVRVEAEAQFRAAKARNAGAAMAQTPWLGFFDADILLDANFAATIRPLLEAGRFYRASPATRQTWGSVICAREDFAAIGGYDETYTGWGAEDDDLLYSLALLGRRLTAFDADLLGEIPHTNEARTAFHPLQDIWLQHRINHAFMHMKFDMLRLFGRHIALEERKAVYEQIRQAILAAQSKGGNAPVVINVPLPRIVIEGPPDDEGTKPDSLGVLQRTLTYTLNVGQRKP